VLSVPSYTALQAGDRPWLFTLLIFIVVLSSTVFGFLLIGRGAQTGSGLAIEMAAYASVASSFVMLMGGIVLSQRFTAFIQRGFQWCATLFIVVVSCVALSQQSYWALIGLGLFILLPQGLEAMKTIVEPPSLLKNDEAE
jgi:hypothetical protein